MLIIFSFIIVTFHQFGQYQGFLSDEKEREATRRAANLGMEAEDITPKNKDTFLWSKAESMAAFEQEYSFKPVKLTGIFNHEKEI